MKTVNSLKLFFHYVSINIRSMMQYKMSFFLTAIGQFLTAFNVLIGVYFMFQRFHGVKGFTYGEVILCYSVFLMSYTLAEMWARGFDAFSGMVRSGEFDRLLVRPRGEVLQVLGSKFEFTRIARFLQAAVMLVYGIAKGGVIWTAGRVLAVFFMLLGGTALFAGLFLIYAALCFFTLDSLEIMNVFTDGAREFGKYPLGIYGKKILRLTTFVIPYAPVQYYPFLYLTGRSENPFYIFVPLLAMLFIIPAYGFWRFGVRRYKSSGS